MCNRSSQIYFELMELEFLFGEKIKNDGTFDFVLTTVRSSLVPTQVVVCYGGSRLWDRTDDVKYSARSSLRGRCAEKLTFLEMIGCGEFAPETGNNDSQANKAQKL